MEIKLEGVQIMMRNRNMEAKLAEKKLEMEKINSKLARANEELVELEKIKMEFLTIISHEIRTSLNGILAPILLLQSKLKDSQYSKLFEILVSSASRLEKFALTSLFITELKTGIRKFSANTINLYDFVQDILINIHIISNEKNLRFDANAIPKDLNIKGDSRLLFICFKGILENAVIYSPVCGTIGIHAAINNNTITCDISDEGPGFSHAALNNLFKLFRPGEPHIDQNLGLDLTLAGLIMEAHTGKIEVENVDGKGARVRLIFPVEIN